MPKSEFWQEYSKSGEPLMNGGRPADHSPESEARPYNYGVACVWLYRLTKDNDIELLFQRRSQYVDRHAGEWDISAGGHVDYGESIIEAAVRETKEEIGAEISQSDLYFLFSLNNNRKRIAYIYMVDYSNRPDNFHFDDHEVSEVKWVPLSKIEDFWNSYAKTPLKQDVPQLLIIKDFLTSIKQNANHSK